MELKRYVLFEDGVLRVKDDILKDKIVTYDKETKEVKVDGKLFRRLSVEVKKTSDNILDLVEVGDLYYYIRIFEFNEFDIEEIRVTGKLGIKPTRIWKRQKNGDYIRYEV